MGNAIRGWSHKNLQNLGYGDPKRLSRVDPSDETSDAVLDALRAVVRCKVGIEDGGGLPSARWEWVTPWRIVRDHGSGTDAQGWEYAARLTIGQSWSSTPGIASKFRRRQWARVRKWVGSGTSAPSPEATKALMQVAGLGFRLTPDETSALASGGLASLDEAIELLTRCERSSGDRHGGGGVSADAQSMLSLQGSSFKHGLECHGTPNLIHPADARLLAVLTRIPAVPTYVRVMGAGAVESAQIKYIAGSLQVGPTQKPHIWACYVDACNAIGVDAAPNANPPPPTLYIKNDPIPNAYTMARQVGRPFIVITSGLINILDASELRFVFGHELGHLVCEHGVYHDVAVEVINGGMERHPVEATSLSVVGFLAIKAYLLRWYRASELSADRIGLLVVADPRVAVSVFAKLASGLRDVDVEAYLRQTETAMTAAARSPLLTASAIFAESHPFNATRVRELMQFAKSKFYQTLLTSVRATAAKLPEPPRASAARMLHVTIMSLAGTDARSSEAFGCYCKVRLTKGETGVK
ncbi:peptidase [Aureococcus anophagefferens]|nr:peptidase [Aureococcus anophagefferens]